MRYTSRNRIIGLATVSLMVALGGTACAGGTKTQPEDAVETGPVNLSFSNWEFLEPGKGDILWKALEDYSGTDKNVTLVKEAAPYGSYADKMSTELGAKGGPDVMILQDSQFATLASAGALVPLDDIAKALGTELNGTNSFGKMDNTQYGFNWERANYALMYNKDVLAKAGVEVPTTFPELLAAAKKIHETLGIYGFAGRHQIAEVDGWTLEMSNWLHGFGGGLSEDGKLTVDSDKNIEAVKAYLELFAAPGVVPIGDDASTFRAKFAQNEVGFLFDNAGIATILTGDPKNLVTGATLGTAALPFPNPGGHTQLMMAVNANSRHKTAAKAFVRYLLSTEGQTAIRSGLSAMTLATDTPSNPDFLKANPWAQTFLDLGKNSNFSVVAGYEKDSRTINREFLTAVEGLRSSGGDVRKSLTEVQDSVVKQFG